MSISLFARREAASLVLPPRRAGAIAWEGWRIQAAMLALAAFAIRAWQFGNPVIEIDEQFYLFVGDRMWHGLLPYVDIWDRKPLGLFLLYAAIRALGGSGILQYQLVATLFATATALVLTRMAARIAARPAALLAGILYLLCLGMSGGDGGQSPVFYNLPVAAAAWIVLRAVERRAAPVGLGGAGLAAMALIGLALQMKESCLFEGLYLGLALLWLAHRAGLPPARIAALAAGWIAAALLPSLLAWAFYALRHHQADYDFANFTSIFLRSPEAAWIIRKRLLLIAAHVVPLMIAAGIGWTAAARADGPSAAHRFLLGWAAAAIVGVLLFGSYFDHYALPLYAPLSVVAAPTLAIPRTRRWGAVSHIPPGAILLVLTAAVSIHLFVKDRRGRGDGRQVEAIAGYLRPRLHDCLFVFDGEPMLYYLTNSCLPTRWSFPDHFANGREAGALGVDPLREVARVMANRPHFVVTSNRPFDGANMQTWRFVAQQMRRDYRPVMVETIGKRQRIVFERLADH